VSEAEALEKNNQEYHARSQDFMEALDCDEVIAHLLVTEGFLKVEELASATPEELSSIEGFTTELATELISRASNFLKQQEAQLLEQVKTAKIDKKIIDLGVFSNGMLLKLAEHKIKKLDDLGDLSNDELTEILPEISADLASDIIMKARAHWFK
jgi:N utilization substance protein A